MHQYLSMHPSVFIHPLKELRFFSEEYNWKKGINWYQRQFSGADSLPAIGESTNIYTQYPVYKGIPARIHALLPKTRLVYLIRPPIQRIVSHYRHRLVMGIEWRGPEEAVLQDPSYIAASSYGLQLQQFLEYFPLEQIFVLPLERLVGHADETLRQLSDFLGIDKAPDLPWPYKNKTAERKVAPRFIRSLSRRESSKNLVRRMVWLLRYLKFDRFFTSAHSHNFLVSPEIHAHLAQMFYADLKTLSSLTKGHFDHWIQDERLAIKT